MTVRPPLPGLSLKRQLLLWLLLPQLVLWSVGGVLAWRIALSYADTGIDQSLKQSVRALARQVKPVGSGLLVDFPRAAQDVLEQDPTDRMGYMVSSPPGSFVLGNGQLPPPPEGIAIQVGEPLIYDAREADKRVRVALLDVTYGEAQAPQRLRVQVAKSLAVQEREARELVFDMLVPLAALGVVLGLLINAGIARGLRPLKRLEAQLGDRTGLALSALPPLALAQAPQEVHSLALAVNELLDAVRRSLSQEKRFVNDAAHQLRTPLAGLVSQSELALQETELQPLRERLVKVHAGALRSAHLVHQLLSLARTEAEVALHPMDVALLAREVAREWTPKALLAHVDLGYEGDDTVLVQGEKLLLREVLNNLIDHALHYAGAHTALTVRVRRMGDHCWLEVEDDGPGLPEADLPRAFERFWRASEIPGGCGLGLAIVAEIALRHRGQAVALAVQPHGLCVRIDLPLLPGSYAHSNP
ncbi:MAG: histidine kinase [Burkholderiales bacterium PBB4]|nr:MAG: histidine kinase [Burkholderiales bacterium PBB4]